MHNGHLSVLLIIIQHFSYTCCRNWKKEIVFAPHSHFKNDSLQWTVQIVHNHSSFPLTVPSHSHEHNEDLYRFGNVYVKSESETKHEKDIAKQVALDCKLVFHGVVGELKHIYLLVHPAVSHTSTDSVGSSHVPDNLTQDIIKDIEAKLDSHPNVIWFHRERVFSRGKRGLHFSDPVFPQQWHLVSYTFGKNISDSYMLHTWYSVC